MIWRKGQGKRRRLHQCLGSCYLFACLEPELTHLAHRVGDFATLSSRCVAELMLANHAVVYQGAGADGNDLQDVAVGVCGLGEGIGAAGVIGCSHGFSCLFGHVAR